MLACHLRTMRRNVRHHRHWNSTTGTRIAEQGSCFACLASIFLPSPPCRRCLSELYSAWFAVITAALIAAKPLRSSSKTIRNRFMSGIAANLLRDYLIKTAVVVVGECDRAKSCRA